jgi:hypothetical protein
MHADDMVLMFNAGWSLVNIAAHFGMDVREVEQAIVKQVRDGRLICDFFFGLTPSREPVFPFGRGSGR